MKNRYTPAFLVFMLIVVGFLVVQNIAIIANQRERLLKNAREHMAHELELMATAAQESLLVRDYVAVENFLRQWGRENDEVVALSAVSANGFSLAEYKENVQPGAVFELEHLVTHQDRELLTFKMVYDLSAIHHELFALSLRLGLGSTLFMLFMGLTLWYSMKKMAIVPLEKEIHLRVRTENSLHKALAELENKSREIDSNREKLEKALTEISSLIQQAAREKTFDIRFNNPNVKKCYELLSCNDQDCPFYGQEGKRCWEGQGTFSFDGKACRCVQKDRECPQCPVYQDATADPLYQIGEQFNQMMHILENKNRELEDAYTELKASQSQLLQREKMASIGQLAAGVAHEINNPIGFVSSNLGTLAKYIERFQEFITLQAGLLNDTADQGQLQLLAQQRKKIKLDYIAEDARELIGESLDGTERVSKIVQGLKGFSRVDQEGHQEADINDCIESTLNIIWNELKYKAEVDKEYGDLPQVACYPQELSQVFMNLLINAAQAIEEHGRITIKTWADDPFIYAAISDTGVGISDEHQSRLFEPFYTTKEVGEGTGLGLSIVYDIVTKKYNGEILVDSRLGQGTTFTVKLPLVENIQKGS